jgi:hypothetical protein
MPPVSQELPAACRPYAAHGVALGPPDRRGECWGACPWCGRGDGARAKKFSVCTRQGNEAGTYHCFVCGESGGPLSFLRRLWEESYAHTPEGAYAGLAANRRLLRPDTLWEWGACKSVLTGDWLLPGYGAGGKLCQLYAYTRGGGGAGGGRFLLLPTAGLPHGLFQPQQQGNAYGTAWAKHVYVCEGPWDGMALYELLPLARKGAGAGGVVPTGNPAGSLADECAVLATPSCSVWDEGWCKLLAGKTAHLLFDSDHPRVHGSVTSPPAGTAGMKRGVNLLSAAPDKPKEVYYLHWGPDGYAPDKPSGYDVRDLLTEEE